MHNDPAFKVYPTSAAYADSEHFQALCLSQSQTGSDLVNDQVNDPLPRGRRVFLLPVEDRCGAVNNAHAEICASKVYGDRDLLLRWEGRAASRRW